MKKTLFAVLFVNLFLHPITANAGTGDSCAGGAGTMVGSNVCVSNISMNWWSAFVWCEKIAGGHLGSLYELCGTLQEKPENPCGGDSYFCGAGYMGDYFRSDVEKIKNGGWTSTYDPNNPTSTIATIRFVNGGTYMHSSPTAGHYFCSFDSSYSGKAICVIN